MLPPPLVNVIVWPEIEKASVACKPFVVNSVASSVSKTYPEAATPPKELESAAAPAAVMYPALLPI